MQGLPVAATSAAAAPPSCIVRPEVSEGPYFVDERLNRVDVRSDPSDGAVSPGTQLDVTFQVSQVNAGACVPLSGMTIDFWHCDAAGRYSDVTDAGFNTSGRKFLRGFQTTDERGIARFTTVYPGWYQGRAVHIHYKLRTNTASGKSYEFTSQLFFDEAVTDVVHATDPYAAKGYRTIRNDGDQIYRNGNGVKMIIVVAPTDVGGYAGTFDVGIDLA